MDYFTVSGSQEQSSEPTPDDERQESLLPLSTSTSTSPAQQQQGQGSVSPPTTSNTGASASNTALGSASTPRIRRRNRMITSCLECRRRKLKCNKSHPCTNCVKFARDCVFLAPALDQGKSTITFLSSFLNSTVPRSS